LQFQRELLQVELLQLGELVEHLLEHQRLKLEDQLIQQRFPLRSSHLL
jgi:hypothetical protein